MRFGNIAMLPVEIYQTDRLINRPQLSFLVEMRSLSGFSGSPVFVYHDGKTIHFHSLNTFIGSPFMFLLGIDWGHMNLKDTGQHTNMSAVIPAWKLQELLDSPDVMKMREEADKEIVKMIERGRALSDVKDIQEDATLERDGFIDASKKVSRPDKPDDDQ